MEEEIFRFSVVRNPQRISTKKLETSVIHLIDDASDEYPIYSKLIGVPKNRGKIIGTAQEGIDSRGFLQNISQLNTKIAEFSEWLFSQRKLKSTIIVDEALELFPFETLSRFVENRDFKLDKYKISDSIVAASIVRPKQNGLRSELMRARRIVFLLEYLAKAENKHTDSKTLRKILNATILLPSDLFPIPDKNQELREENEKAKEVRKEKIKENIDKINDASEKLRLNNEAIDELRESYSKHLFEMKNTPRLDDDPSHSLTFIPPDKFNDLSPNTRNIVTEDVGIREETVDVAFAVKSIESENRKLTYKINSFYSDHDTVDKNNEFPIIGVDLVKEICGACKTVLIEDPKQENNFTGQTKGKVNNLGIQDLMMVRQKILKYETGEIAHIENVLKGESKSKEHRKLHRVEETVFEETERTEESENELETTDRFELQSETSKTISQDSSLEAGVKVTASYGPVNIEAHGNYARSNATEESRNSATTYSKDIVSRSMQKIKERVLKRRSRTDITEVEIINKHKIDNAPNSENGITGDKNVAGIYRWVNKLYEAQVVNYGGRTMLEFMVPEPAAFYRFAVSCLNSMVSRSFYVMEGWIAQRL